MANEWTDEELTAAVYAYKNMMDMQARGDSFSKKDVFRGLAGRFGRSASAFEYRMQNISAVLTELGQPWLKGFAPAANVGEGVKRRLALILKNAEDTSSPDSYKRKLPAMRNWLIGIARARSTVTYSDAMRTFDVDRFTLRHALARLGEKQGIEVSQFSPRWLSTKLLGDVPRG